MPRSRTQPSASSPATPQTPELLARRKPASRRFARKKFAEVQCIETGFQHGSQKIYQSDDPNESKLKEWRNDLAALSHRYNLYLVAGREKIWAYRPRYPSQQIPKHPQLMIASPRFDEASHGYIDVLDPHAINHLMVANFGSDEIVVCACDDGDVYAYLTQQIDDALSERHDSPPPDQSVLVGHLRPFFHQNISLSAWGLAVHEKARLIAASCNTHNIHVFALALASTRGSSPECDDGEQTSPSLDENDWTFSSTEIPSQGRRIEPDGWHTWPDPPEFTKRHKNYMLTLPRRHENNVPALAFCNTGDDPEGRFLISTDIEGQTIIWDLVHQTSERAHKRCSGIGAAGWALHFLDRRAFRRSKASSAFPPHTKYGIFTFDDTFATVDLSGTRNELAKGSFWDPTSSSGDRQAADDTTDDAEEEFEELLDAGLDLIERRMGYDVPFAMDTDDSEDSDGGVPTGQSPRRARAALIGPKTLHSGIKDYSGLPEWRCSLDWPISSRIFVPTGAIELKSLLPTPVLLFSATTVTMFQTTQLEDAPPSKPYTVFEEPLAQDGPADMVFRMRHMDRMNLTIQIPELGIVLAGSQKGRVGVFSLHQVWPNPFVESSWAPFFAIRLDKILPSSEQEAQAKRPLSALIGLSAAPMQGSQRKDKWRVMLLYRDHTVLSYQLTREQEAEDDKGRTGIAVGRDDVPFV